MVQCNVFLPHVQLKNTMCTWLSIQVTCSFTGDVKCIRSILYHPLWWLTLDVGGVCYSRAPPRCGRTQLPSPHRLQSSPESWSSSVSYCRAGGGGSRWPPSQASSIWHKLFSSPPTVTMETHYQQNLLTVRDRTSAGHVPQCSGCPNQVQFPWQQ